MAELFVILGCAVHLAKGAAPLAFDTQSVKLRPVMQKFRKGLVPAGLIKCGFAPFALAHGIPASSAPGSAVEERGGMAEVRRDGVTLDEAVRMAEAQYHARVVRTDVQDEDGRKVYVLKLLSDNGRVITVRVDAASGR